MRLFPTVLACLFASGCASSDVVLAPRKELPDTRPGAQKQYPGELMFVSSDGKKVGFSAREIIELAEAYIDSHGLRASITREHPEFGSIRQVGSGSPQYTTKE